MWSLTLYRQLNFQTQDKWVGDAVCGRAREKEINYKGCKHQLLELQFSVSWDPLGRQSKGISISSLDKSGILKILSVALGLALNLHLHKAKIN